MFREAAHLPPWRAGLVCFRLVTTPIAPSPHIAVAALFGLFNTRYLFAPGIQAHRECSSSCSHAPLSVRIQSCTAIFIAYPDLCRRRLRVRSATTLYLALSAQRCPRAFIASGAAGFLFRFTLPYHLVIASFPHCSLLVVLF